jgi:hypothetical protein
MTVLNQLCLQPLMLHLRSGCFPQADASLRTAYPQPQRARRDLCQVDPDPAPVCFHNPDDAALSRGLSQWGELRNHCMDVTDGNNPCVCAGLHCSSSLLVLSTQLLSSATAPLALLLAEV